LERFLANVEGFKLVFNTAELVDSKCKNAWCIYTGKLGSFFTPAAFMNFSPFIFPNYALGTLDLCSQQGPGKDHKCKTKLIFKYQVKI